MTNTFDMIKKSLYLRAKEFPMALIGTGAGFVLGHLILIAVMNFDKSPDLTSFEAGTMMAAMFTFFSSISVGANKYSSHFNYAVSMGKRRIDATTSQIVISLMKGVCTTSLIYVFHLYERFVCSTAYSQYPSEFNFDTIFTFRNYFIFVSAFAAIETFLGAMNTRFGKKVYGLLWQISILIIFIPQFIVKLLDKICGDVTAKIGQFFIDLFNSTNLNILLAGGVALIVLLLLLPYALLKKCRVSL